jgi:hypothetical protein
LLRRDAKRTPPPNEVPERGSATTDSSPETFSAGTELPCGAEIGRRLRAASSITVPDRSTADPVGDRLGISSIGDVDYRLSAEVVANDAHKISIREVPRRPNQFR